jgi:hypothetical protein
VKLGSLESNGGLNVHLHKDHTLFRKDNAIQVGAVWPHARTAVPKLGGMSSVERHCMQGMRLPSVLQLAPELSLVLLNLTPRKPCNVICRSPLGHEEVGRNQKHQCER